MEIHCGVLSISVAGVHFNPFPPLLEVIKDMADKIPPWVVQVTEEEAKELGIKIPPEAAIQDPPKQLPVKTSGQVYYESYADTKGLRTPWSALGVATRAAYERKAADAAKKPHRPYTARDWEAIKDEVLSDYKSLKLKDFYVRWKLNSGRWKLLKQQWDVKGKGRSHGKHTESGKTPQKPGQPGQTGQGLPVLPPWSEIKGEFPSVKIAWLQAVVEITALEVK